MDFRFSAGPTWRWTPRLFQPCTATGRPNEEQRTVTGLRWSRLAATKNALPRTGKVAGRWSEEAASFIRQFAKARARSKPPVLVKRAEQAWRLRWFSMFACTAARAFAGSLLDRRLTLGVDGVSPSVHDVVGEARFAGLS